MGTSVVLREYGIAKLENIPLATIDTAIDQARRNLAFDRADAGSARVLAICLTQSASIVVHSDLSMLDPHDRAAIADQAVQRAEEAISLYLVRREDGRVSGADTEYLPDYEGLLARARALATSP